MRIFVRASKKNYVDSDLVFRVITRGIEFYSKMFDYPFPFAKYDVIYCPEFRISAMENVGAVTFSDSYLIPANEMNDAQKTLHYYIHLHELAHMWFGDLTTMVWWNDLWLKESFADFLSATCIHEVVHTEDPSFNDTASIWLSFLGSGLHADLKPSTHPISLEIKHTGEAVSMFDMISYRKGASWIKTMDYFIGRPALSLACQKYCKRFKYSNAKLEDFVECLDEAVKEANSTNQIDVRQWTNSWLKSAGPSQLECSVDEDCMTIKQSFPKYADEVYRS